MKKWQKVRAYLAQRLALNITWKLLEKKTKITHVARFPNIVAALFIFDNLLKVLKKKKRRRKVLLNEIIYKTIYIAIKLLSLFKKKKKKILELNWIMNRLKKRKSYRIFFIRNEKSGNYIWFSFTTAKRHAARFSRADVARWTIEVIVAIPVFRALDAATL